MSRAWDFANYGCGHSTPVRGGERQIAGPCPSCQPGFRQGRTIEHDPQLCGQCAEAEYLTPRAPKP